MRPAAGQEVSARAVVPARTTVADLAGTTKAAASAVVAVGYDAREIPAAQRGVVAAGGGPCAASIPMGEVTRMIQPMISHLSADRVDTVRSAAGSATSTLRVRAAVMGNTIPQTPDRREIRWKHGRYYGIDTVLGLLRFSYNPDRRSAVSIVGAGAGADFFPASGVNQIYCKLEVLELGLTAYNAEPMYLPSSSFTWPPYSTPMSIVKPVQFFEEADPDHLVMTIEQNRMELYDYNGVTIKKQSFGVTAAGLINAVYTVSNQTDSPFTGRWMLLGDHTDQGFVGTDAALTLGPAGSRSDTATITVAAPVRRSELSQKVGLAVMSLSEPVVLGILPTQFKYPRG